MNALPPDPPGSWGQRIDRKSTRLNSSHVAISYAVFCLNGNWSLHDGQARVMAQHKNRVGGERVDCDICAVFAQFQRTRGGFFFNDTATTEIYTLSLPDALPISSDWLLRPELLFRFIEEYSGSFCWLPNFAFSYLAQRKDMMQGVYSLGRMRAWVNCSEPVRRKSFAEFAEQFG